MNKYDGHDYQSMIRVAITDRNAIIEDGILKEVYGYGIHIDKEELLKALKYDRNQYEKGYEDGYRVLEKALDKACELLERFTGSCPLDSFDVDLNCNNKCENQMVECWKEWLTKDENS